jgi:hypothetical protein
MKPMMNPLVYEKLLTIPNVTNTQEIANLSTLAAEGPTPKLYVALFTLILLAY